MVIIITDVYDTSTSKVMASLQVCKLSITRVNQNIGIKNIRYSNRSFTIETEQDKYIQSGFSTSSVWYRRGSITFKVPVKSTDIKGEEIGNYLTREWDVFSYFIYDLNFIIKLGSFNKEKDNNKIFNLFSAKSVGIDIPEMLLTNQKAVLLKFTKSQKYVITKPLNRSISLFDGSVNWNSDGTLMLNEGIVGFLSDNFFPTLFQEYIEKSYEIRVFYLKGKIYSMAIFSQLDEQTKTDYRNYNRAKPNRNVPYQLPLEIEEKIRLFMDKSGLDTGSLDIIRATDGRFVFLEVNPCGQFDWLSGNCNYYLEQKIANYLAYGTID